ncbi:TPA: hypothetical protein OT818_003619 [Citrobacter koseri]|nr:hypothetical protein [Citrobacter koseri]
MAKRAKIESMYLVISSSGYVHGAGLDPSDAWKDAVNNNNNYSDIKHMAMSGNYGLVEACASATYDPEALKNSFDGWKKIADEFYGRTNP